MQELWDTLSTRQMRIARMVAYCKADPEITRELHLGTDTVAAQLNHILRKLNVGSRTMLVRVMAALID